MQPLDNNYIACIKNVYKRWLNLEIFKTEEIPSKFDKLKKGTEILYDLRTAIGKYCWDATLYKGSEEPEAPEEIIASEVEILEERMLKITDGFDQMHIEDDIEGNEEIDYVELVEIPEIEIISEEITEKVKVQSKITTFFTEKKQ